MRGLRVASAELLSNFLDSSFKNGVLVLKSGKNTARFLPSLNITKEEIDSGFTRLESAIKEMGF